MLFTINELSGDHSDLDDKKKKGRNAATPTFQDMFRSTFKITFPNNIGISGQAY